MGVSTIPNPGDVGPNHGHVPHAIDLCAEPVHEIDIPDTDVVSDVRCDSERISSRGLSSGPVIYHGIVVV